MVSTRSCKTKEVIIQGENDSSFFFGPSQQSFVRLPKRSRFRDSLHIYTSST